MLDAALAQALERLGAPFMAHGRGVQRWTNVQQCALWGVAVKRPTGNAATTGGWAMLYRFFTLDRGAHQGQRPFPRPCEPIPIVPPLDPKGGR